MKLLMVGGGGREHALLWKLQRDDPALELLAAPGNPGIAELARCVPVAATDTDGLVSLIAREHVDVTIVGPEGPLAAGLVDRIRAANGAIFGPTAAAAEIETSKAFAKDLMRRAGIPTASASLHTDPSTAKRAARALGAPVVIKASGLAGGKGVIVCGSMGEADEAIDSMLLHGAMGAGGAEVLVEEFMQGEELSIFAICDGYAVLPMLPAQDHKRLLNGDAGPNTGGMGAYAPVSIATPELTASVRRQILEPTIDALREVGRPFTGLLYAGIMVTPDGPKVVEFNCRFGDPETQALIPLLRSSLLDPLVAVATGAKLGAVGALQWSDSAAVTTVLAAENYPSTPRTGDPIELPPPEAGVEIFHAGTSRAGDGVLRTAGGRVVAVTATGATVMQAGKRSSAAAAEIRFPGRHFRTDIGWRETARHAGAS
jgi:phosphoribosylamine--glycine ligase